MARLTRKELKTDTLATRLASVTEIFLSNRKKLAVGGAVILLLLAGGWGGSLYLQSREAEASEAFGQALSTYHGLVSPTPPPNLNLPSFATEKEKYEEAQKQFLTVAERFSRFSQGRWARYYAALCQRDLGNLSGAEQELSPLAKASDPELAAQAKMALAGIYQQDNRKEEAEKLYQELLQGRPTATVPKATVQMALADLYQETDPSRALEIYQQMAKEYSGTTIGDVVTDLLQNIQ
ncbi:MAG: tetratricopeptide repeat protein [Acidobacteria bacterium]|nr:tetratricopeptide repeat protein [Acidobacteriota bacterium]